MLTKIDHIALAVPDLEVAIGLYSAVWGLTVEHREKVEEQKVEEAMLRIGESYIQLLTPTSADSTVAKFLSKRGSGLHHIAYHVNDIQQTLARLKESGARLLDEEPRKGSRNTLVAFVHPGANLGVLAELVQYQ
jgi:methylmalonyl-CoA/ethylmalonyl-CoA epimerase